MVPSNGEKHLAHGAWISQEGCPDVVFDLPGLAGSERVRRTMAGRTGRFLADSVGLARRAHSRWRMAWRKMIARITRSGGVICGQAMRLRNIREAGGSQMVMLRSRKLATRGAGKDRGPTHRQRMGGTAAGCNRAWIYVGLVTSPQSP